MAKYGHAFSITGEENKTTPDDGLSSPETEKRHVEKIILNVSVHIGNTIQVWMDREKFFEIYDYSLDTVEAAAGDTPYKSTRKQSEIEIDREIPQGATMNVAIKCGGTASNVHGTYIYRLV